MGSVKASPGRHLCFVDLPLDSVSMPFGGPDGIS